MSLVAAIQTAKALDTDFHSADIAMHTAGITKRYGNTSMTGRANESIKRQQSKSRKKKDATLDSLLVAQEIAANVEKILANRSKEA